MMVPLPTSDFIFSESELFLIFGKPIPAPNPISRTFCEAVEYPFCMAFSISGMPGPHPQERYVHGHLPNRHGYRHDMRAPRY